MKPGHNDQDADCHFAASTFAAVVCFPLWKASAIAQSGFKLEGSNALIRYFNAVAQPPYRGVAATIFGMSWARGAIFFGADTGKSLLNSVGCPNSISTGLPPLLVGILVQVCNQPLVRATITIQDPKSNFSSTTSALAHIYKIKGVAGLWHGTSAACMKTVPKYMAAIAVKDYMEETLPRVDVADKYGQMTRSAIKSVVAGIAGAVLTNPLDVLRNEGPSINQLTMIGQTSYDTNRMFKTDLGLLASFQKLLKEEGWNFMARGVTSNTTAVAVPVAITIFMTDIFKGIKRDSFA